MKLMSNTIGNFRDIIMMDRIYVDKTKIIYDMIKTKAVFISRPRRFGKSVLASTFQELFLGNRELFKGLWIDSSNHEWSKHPVIYLNFSVLEHATATELQCDLVARLQEIGLQYGITLDREIKVTQAVRILVTQLSARSQVVVLVDEYDYPIINHLRSPTQAERMVKTLRTFYTALKAVEHHCRFIFLTGVSRFSSTGVFSGLNNLKNLTLDDRAAHLLGYTEEEIRHYFSQHIQSFADAKKRSFESIMDEMKAWYNGYRFSENLDLPAVYNPFSVQNYLEDRKCSNYWFLSGTPTFLIEQFKQRFDHELPPNLENIELSAAGINAFEVGKPIPLATLLFQTGYLTIKAFNHGIYQLGTPNQEVRESLSSYLLSVLASSDEEKTHLSASHMRSAILAGDLPAFFAHVKAVLAGVPYNLRTRSEAYFHLVVHVITTLLGLEVQSEMATSEGRIDLVLTTPHSHFIFEFKFGSSAAQALTQIRDRRYYEKFLPSPKATTLVGVAFNYKNKKLEIDWATEKP